MAEVVGSSPTLRTRKNTLKPVWALRVIFYAAFYDWISKDDML